MFFGFIFTLILSLATLCSPIQAETPQQTTSTETGSIPELARLEQLLETIYEEKINKELLFSPELNGRSVRTKIETQGWSSLSKEHQWIFLYEELSVKYHLLLELYTIALRDKARQQANALTDIIEQQAQTSLALSSLDNYQYNEEVISDRFFKTFYNIISTQESFIAFGLNCFSKVTPGHHGRYYYSTIKDLKDFFNFTNFIENKWLQKNNLENTASCDLSEFAQPIESQSIETVTIKKTNFLFEEMTPDEAELLIDIMRHALTGSQQGREIEKILISTNNTALLAAIDSFTKSLERGFELAREIEYNNFILRILQQQTLPTKTTIAHLKEVEQQQQKLELQLELAPSVSQAHEEINKIFINLDEQTKAMLKEVFSTEFHQKSKTKRIIKKGIAGSMIICLTAAIATATYGMFKLFAYIPISFPVWH